MKKRMNLMAFLLLLSMLAVSLCACEKAEAPTESPINSGGMSEVVDPSRAEKENQAKEGEEENLVNPLFRCGLVPVCADGKWGYVDKAGNYAINPQFDQAEPFSPNGLACVNIGGKFGYINTAGTYVINPQFDEAFPFGGKDLACVMIAERVSEENVEKLYSTTDYGMYYDDGEWYSEPAPDYWVSYKYGYIDQTGAYVITPQFGYAENFGKDGFACVGVGDYWRGSDTSIYDNCKYGYIDHTGSFIGTPQFDWALRFVDDFTLVQVGSKYGYIDKTGCVIAPQFDRAELFADNGLAVVEINGKYGYINQQGIYVINPQFDYAETFGDNGLAAVRIGENYGYIDETGTFVINPQFGEASEFGDNGLAWVQIGEYENRKCGYIDQMGSYVVAPKYSDLDIKFSAGLCAFKNENGLIGYLDSDGNEVIQAQFASDEYSLGWSEFEDRRFFDDGYAIIEVGDQKGVIDKTGKWIIHPQFGKINNQWW